LDLLFRSIAAGVVGRGVVPHPVGYTFDQRWTPSPPGFLQGLGCGFVHAEDVVAEAVPDTPIFIYDNTLTTRVHFTPAKVVKLLETVPNICGIKASYSPLAEIIDYVKTLPDQIGVFPGSILFLLPGYSLGVRGAIHPPTSPFPEICVQLYRALKANDLAAAHAVHDKIAELNLFMEGYSGEHGRAVMFEAMKLRGLPVKKFPRWECKPFTDLERGAFREGIERIGIELVLTR